MEYVKPEVNLVMPAMRAVQHTDANKADPIVQDSQLTSGTSAAYEADE